MITSSAVNEEPGSYLKPMRIKPPWLASTEIHCLVLERAAFVTKCQTGETLANRA